MAETIRWGLLGAGNIINRWIHGANQLIDSGEMEIAAVASRTPESAQKMAEKYNIPRACTYDEMIADPTIRAVYIPVPHNAHYELALRALDAGKAVLLEKPACVNEAQLRSLIAKAKEKNVFFMEAVWTRFFPLYTYLIPALRGGLIGDVRMVQANFACRATDLSSRLWDPMRAGGGLLDIGVYDLFLADMIYGEEPVEITTSANIMRGVDSQASWIARQANGAMSVMSCGLEAWMSDTAMIYGTNGSIEIPRFWSPDRMILTQKGTRTEQRFPVAQRIETERDEGFAYELRHVRECLLAGRIESPVATWESSLRILRQCDILRGKWDLVYPFEKA